MLIVKMVRALIGEGEPPHSGEHIATLAFVSLLILGGIGFWVYLYATYDTDNRDYFSYYNCLKSGKWPKGHFVQLCK